MLSIGNKKYRNLQEQVGYNTECIKKLDEYLDGIDIDDKLVIIANDSGTFSADDLDVLSAPLAFISNGSRVWMKDSESASELVFKAIDIKAEEVGSAYFNIGGSKIVINRVTGYFEIVDDAIITTYSKDQLDTFLNGKADLAGATFTGAVVAPTLEQTQPNWSYDLTSITPSTQTGFTVTNIFSRLQKINGELEIIFTFSIKNDTASTATPSNVQLGSFDLPANIASKIIDVNGIPLTQSVALTAIAGSALINANGVSPATFAGQYGVLNISHRGTQLFIACYGLQAIGAGATQVYSGRIQLTLI